MIIFGIGGDNNYPHAYISALKLIVLPQIHSGSRPTFPVRVLNAALFVGIDIRG